MTEIMTDIKERMQNYLIENPKLLGAPLVSQLRTETCLIEKIRSYLSGDVPFRRTSLADQLLSASLEALNSQKERINALTQERNDLQKVIVDLYANIRPNFGM